LYSKLSNIKKKRNCTVQIFNAHCMCGFIDSVSRIHFNFI
jgi:hypothetical protein